MTTQNPWSPSNFTRADPGYFKVKLFGWALGWGIGLLIALVPLLLVLLGLEWPLWLVIAPPVIVVLLAALLLRILRRQVRALGYWERDTELIVCSGVMWRKQVAIPYGRMQYVEVNSGPLERRYGLCRLTLNTAGQSATAAVYGLPEAQGAALRERLVAAGEAQMI